MGVRAKINRVLKLKNSRGIEKQLDNLEEDVFLSRHERGTKGKL